MRRKPPTLSAIEILKRNLAYNYYSGITSDDASDLNEAIREGVKNRDWRAVKIAHERAQAAGSTMPRSVTATQVNVYGGEEEILIEEPMLSNLRKQIAWFLESELPKPVKTPKLRKELNQPTHIILAVMTHPWFRDEGDGWRLMDQARKDGVVEQTIIEPVGSTKPKKK